MLHQLFLLTALAPLSVYSLLVFSIPAPATTSTFAANSPITIQWTEDGKTPVQSAAGQWTLSLCTGGNTDATMSCTLNPFMVPTGPVLGPMEPTGSTTSIQILPKAGGPGPYYFFKMVWPVADGVVTTYSNRFLLNGMTGSFTPAVAAQNAAPWTIPAAEIPDASNDTPAASSGSDPWAVPYSLQNGPVRYAPMQKQPGSTITAKGAKRQYPTSSYNIFTAISIPTGMPTTTLTQSWTYTLSSVVNGASPAPNPQDDMQKYLNRWKD